MRLPHALWSARRPRPRASMSFRVAPTVAASRGARRGRRPPDRRAAGWLVGPGALPPGTTVVVGSLRRARSCADLGADLRRAAELLPGGLEIVGAYVAGDKPEAEALVAEVKPHLEGGFAVATTRPDGSAAFHHRFSTADAIVAAAHDPLPPGWLEREYALFRCAFAARVEGPLGDDDVDADAAFAASVDAAARGRRTSAVFLVRLPAPPRPRRSGFGAPAAAPPRRRAPEARVTRAVTRAVTTGQQQGRLGKNSRATDDDDGAFRPRAGPARLVAGVGALATRRSSATRFPRREASVDRRPGNDRRRRGRVRRDDRADSNRRLASPPRSHSRKGPPRAVLRVRSGPRGGRAGG